MLSLPNLEPRKIDANCINFKKMVRKLKKQQDKLLNLKVIDPMELKKRITI